MGRHPSFGLTAHQNKACSRLAATFLSVRALGTAQSHGKPLLFKINYRNNTEYQTNNVYISYIVFTRTLQTTIIHFLSILNHF